jgi:endonuclease III
MIGEPGADRILAITGAARLLPIDSNALRVLQRLRLAPEAKDYRTSYRMARTAVSGQLPRSQEAILEGGELLRMHGQELCRRSTPSCPDCPLRSACPSWAGPAPVQRLAVRRSR